VDADDKSGLYGLINTGGTIHFKESQIKYVIMMSVAKTKFSSLLKKYKLSFCSQAGNNLG
jgi:hypothetical protein